MKLLAIYMLSSLAIAAPQEDADELSQILAEALEEIELAVQEITEEQEQVEEGELAYIGLNIAEASLAVVSDLLPAAVESANVTVGTLNRSLADANRVLIGITGSTPSTALCSHLDLDAEQCFIITSIIPGMSAERAGLREHDVIIAIGGNAGATLAKLRTALDAMEVGYVLELTIIRNGQRRPIAVPILKSQERTVASEGIRGLYQDAAKERQLAGLYGELALRSLAENHQEATRVRSELSRAQEDLTSAKHSIAIAKAQYEQALVQLLENANEDSAAEGQRKAVEQYELLRSKEAKNLAIVRELETLSLSLQERDAAREAVLREREETRFVNDGRWSTLLVRDRLEAGEHDTRDQTRIGRVEERVDELHSRFDRLEEMLERLAPRRDN